jgi:hypothetical protein
MNEEKAYRRFLETYEKFNEMELKTKEQQEAGKELYDLIKNKVGHRTPPMPRRQEPVVEPALKKTKPATPPDNRGGYEEAKKAQKRKDEAIIDLTNDKGKEEEDEDEGVQPMVISPVKPKSPARPRTPSHPPAEKSNKEEESDSSSSSEIREGTVVFDGEKVLMNVGGTNYVNLSRPFDPIMRLSGDTLKVIDLQGKTTDQLRILIHANAATKGVTDDDIDLLDRLPDPLIDLVHALTQPKVTSRANGVRAFVQEQREKRSVGRKKEIVEKARQRLLKEVQEEFGRAIKIILTKKDGEYDDEILEQLGQQEEKVKTDRDKAVSRLMSLEPDVLVTFLSQDDRLDLIKLAEAYPELKPARGILKKQAATKPELNQVFIAKCHTCNSEIIGKKFAMVQGHSELKFCKGTSCAQEFVNKHYP